jgi:small subunit ribosomal protein S16
LIAFGKFLTFTKWSEHRIANRLPAGAGIGPGWSKRRTGPNGGLEYILWNFLGPAQSQREVFKEMAVKIRLARGGRKKRPFYRIVVASSEAPRDGRFIERIGTYNPLPLVAEVQIDKERLQYWLEQGAKPTDTVLNLIRKLG